MQDNFRVTQQAKRDVLVSSCLHEQLYRSATIASSTPVVFREDSEIRYFVAAICLTRRSSRRIIQSLQADLVQPAGQVPTPGPTLCVRYDRAQGLQLGIGCPPQHSIAEPGATLCDFAS